MARAEDEGGTGPPRGDAGPPFRAQDPPSARWSRVSHVLGWASWPFFVWRPHPGRGPGDPGAIRSIVHTGYALSAAALAVDLVLWRRFFLPGAPVFLLGHLVWISAVGSLLLLNSGFLQRLDGQPLARLGLANLLTVVRASFLPLLLYLLWLGLWTAALAVYVVLGLTDVVDGAVARRRHEESRLGFILDPFVDVLFHLGVLLTLAEAEVISWLTGALVAGRYLLLLGGCGVLFLAKGEIWIQPTPFGKATGLLISFLTGLLLFLLGLNHATPGLLRVIDRGLAVIFFAAILHVLVIGRTNLRRPAEEGGAVYLRGRGLLLGRAARRRGRPHDPDKPL
jgi:cardiolipin synthase (CMP-forming)